MLRHLKSLIDASMSLLLTVSGSEPELSRSGFDAQTQLS